MGWQDAPIASGGDGGPAWASAPEISDPKAIPGNEPPAVTVTPQAKPGIVDRYIGDREALLSIGSGIPAQLAGRAYAAVQAFRPSNYGTPEGAARAQAAGAEVADALTYQPRTETGRERVQKVGQAFEASKLEGLGPMTPPVATGASAAVPRPIAGRPVAPKVSAAVQGGFSLTPDEAGAGPIARAASGFSGEPKLARQTSNKNAALATEKIADDLGLPKGAELDLDTITQVRRDAHKPYEALRTVGPMQTGAEYGAALDDLVRKYANASKEFPEMARQDVLGVADGLRVPSFTGSGAVDMISQLRESADSAFRSGNTGLGKVLRGGAEAIENELGRHLQASGQTQLLGDYQAARTRIAQAYMAEKALVGDQINPQAYAKALEKGRPLTGGAREVGEFAKEFPRSAQKPTKMNVGAPTWADAIMAAVTHREGGGLGSAALDALTAGARPVGRAVLSSRPYQRFQASQMNATPMVPSPDAAAYLGVAPVILPQEQTR